MNKRKKLIFIGAVAAIALSGILAVGAVLYFRDCEEMRNGTVCDEAIENNNMVFDYIPN